MQAITTHMPIITGKSSREKLCRKLRVLIYIRTSPGKRNEGTEQLAFCYEAGVSYKLIVDDTELIIIYDDSSSRKNELNPGLENALAYVREQQVSAFITCTTVRVTDDRVKFMFVDTVCAQNGTKLILAGQSTEKKMEYAEVEHLRQIDLSNRKIACALARETMRNELTPFVKLLSYILDYETKIKRSNYLFQSELIEKLKQGQKVSIATNSREEARKAVKAKIAATKIVHLPSDSREEARKHRADVPRADVMNAKIAFHTKIVHLPSDSQEIARQEEEKKVREEARKAKIARQEEAKKVREKVKKKVRKESRKAKIAREETRKVREEEKKKVREKMLKEILERCAC